MVCVTDLHLVIDKKNLCSRVCCEEEEEEQRSVPVMVAQGNYTFTLTLS